jgi:hypothetical protein
MGCGPSSNRPSKHNLPNSAPVKILFNKYDKDKSGMISRREFYDLCFAMGYRLSPEELNLDMQILGDKDGNIDYVVCKCQVLISSDTEIIFWDHISFFISSWPILISSWPILISSWPILISSWPKLYHDLIKN